MGEIEDKKMQMYIQILKRGTKKEYILPFQISEL